MKAPTNVVANNREAKLLRPDRSVLTTARPFVFVFTSTAEKSVARLFIVSPLM